MTQPRKHQATHSTASNILIAVLCVAMLVGAGIIAYPSVANWFNRMHQAQAVTTYQSVVKTVDREQRERMLSDAHAYNRDLLSSSNRWHPSEEELARYASLLDVTGTGIMGYVSIPTLDVRIPVYHGTNEEVLQVAVGHLTGSSLPVGGSSTHAVVSGHTGLPSAKLLTGLDTLAEGDQFSMTVFDQEYWYEVDQIRVVLPTEFDDLNIDNDADYMTLITCTPYGINTHRLLVRGHAIATPTRATSAQYDNPDHMWRIMLAIIALIFAGIVVLIIALVRRGGNVRIAHHAK